MRRKSRPGRRGSAGADRGLEVEQTDAVAPAWLGPEPFEGVVVEAGGQDRFQESARLAHSLGRGAIDRPVQAHDAAEGADRIALVGAFERGWPMSAAMAAPQGLLCLRMHAAGSANWRTSRNALSRSSRLL